MNNHEYSFLHGWGGGGEEAYIKDLAQDYSDFIANALKLLQSCAAIDMWINIHIFIQRSIKTNQSYIPDTKIFKVYFEVGV